MLQMFIMVMRSRSNQKGKLDEERLTGRSDFTQAFTFLGDCEGYFYGMWTNYDSDFEFFRLHVQAILVGSYKTMAFENARGIYVAAESAL